MRLLKILLVFTFCYVAAEFRNVEEHEESIYTGSHKYFRHVLRGHKLDDSKSGKFERWFTQRLDHFNPNDERKWQQRYYVNDEFFNTTSRNVAFLLIGDEGNSAGDWITQGAWYSLYAKHFKPILFLLEHRYYGRSQPRENISTENLVYLTSQQALADLAFFIDAMNEQHELSSDVKWIVFGGSYAGSLAAWMRQKYPHLVHGAVASSAPLLAKLDVPEFLKVTQDTLRANSDECADAVKMGIDQIDTLLLHNAGQRILSEKFNLCNNIEQRIINNPDDVSYFFYSLAMTFSLTTEHALTNVCFIMTSESFGMEIDRLAMVNSLALESECMSHKYDEFLAELRNCSSDVNSVFGTRQWAYQICTEFGLFQTSSYKPQIFGNKFGLDFYVKLCEDVFGPQFNKIFLENVVTRTNVLYGGLDIEVNNVVFVQGSQDPWHVLGITQTKNNGAPAILIKGGCHISDMLDPSENDTPQLKAARVQIEGIIGSWLDL